MQKKKAICIIFLALLITVFMTGCTVWATHESATIGCYSYQIDGILSARANFPYLNYDSDNNGSPDSSRVFARVTDTSTGTVLADVARVVIPEGEDVESVGFTSDSLSYVGASDGALIDVTYYLPAGGDLADEHVMDSASGICVYESGWDPGDGRLNPDTYAYASVYCDDAAQAVVVWGINSPGAGSINDGSGFPAFRVPYSDLPPVPTGQNILIAELGAVRFYRNLQGEYVVIAGPDAEGKEYVVLWDACPPSYVQRFIKQADTLQRTQ